MSTISPVPGYAIGAIATASGTDFLDAALGLAAVVGGIAGPGAGLEAPAGDIVHPGLNLVSAGRDHAAWRRAEELLLEPLDACQRTSRNFSRASNPGRLDHLQFSPLADGTHGIVERSKAGLFKSPGATVEFVDDQRHITALRTPTFFLRSPDLATLDSAMPEVLDAAPFLHYDGLFDRLLSKGTTKERQRVGRRLVALVAGGDEAIARNPQVGPGRIDAIQAHLFATASRDQLGAALASDHDDVQRLLRCCILLDPAQTGPGEKMDLPDVRHGYLAYFEAIKSVLDARRSGEGKLLSLKPEEAALLHDFTLELQGWWHTIPARLQPLFSGTLSLPYRLCWAFLATLARKESDAWVVPFTMAVTWQLLERQHTFLEELIVDTEALDHRRARTVMLGKLATGPCLFRDLLRRYSVQRKDVHEPVLNELVQEGLIDLRQDGYLELSDTGRKAA